MGDNFARLVSALQGRGVSLVGWANLPGGIALMGEAGDVVVFPRARLGERADSLVDELAGRFRRWASVWAYRPDDLPQWSERELRRLQLVRWLYEKRMLDEGGAVTPLSSVMV
jgi:hypothetical protein